MKSASETSVWFVLFTPPLKFCLSIGNLGENWIWNNPPQNYFARPLMRQPRAIENNNIFRWFRLSIIKNKTPLIFVCFSTAPSAEVTENRKIWRHPFGGCKNSVWGRSVRQEQRTPTAYWSARCLPQQGPSWSVFETAKELKNCAWVNSP